MIKFNVQHSISAIIIINIKTDINIRYPEF